MADITIFTNNCQWDDIIRLEIARIRLGINKLSQFLVFLADWEELQVECGITGKQIPSQAHYFRCLVGIGSEAVHGYFHLLREECEQYNLYGSKIDIWDGRFLDSYGTGQKRPGIAVWPLDERILHEDPQCFVLARQQGFAGSSCKPHL